VSDAGGALVFIGFMGAGKSVAAREAAEAQGARAVDADALVESDLGSSIAEYFEREGEAAFRAREEALVGELLERAGPGEVIALGGGALGSERVRRALEPHVAVLLEVEAEEAWARAAGAARPLARDREAFGRLLEERTPVYEAAADAFIPAHERGGIAPALPALRSIPPGARLVWAAAASGSYGAWVGSGVVESGFFPAPGRRYCVTDETVGPLHGGRLRDLAATVTIPPGEEHKTLESAERVLRELARAGMTRGDVVVALGGGVVGDLAGFCAATYQRGVPVVQVPTTLVAQVDSAYGGKTGVDLPEGKNYVGAYHQPAAVLVDPSLLATLPAAERAAGYAEVLKTALIAGGTLWERVRGGARGDEEEVILACARAKIAIVARDERDAGMRQVLNLGHTVGHAIETATGYGRYRHGEAVALGLLAALRLSGAQELRAEVAGLLEAHGLPTALDADPAAVAGATARDKKRTGSDPVPFVLLERPGEPRPGCAVGSDAIAAAVAELADARP
jgi:shikimate kinase / 3-dehydroquinate synthase